MWVDYDASLPHNMHDMKKGRQIHIRDTRMARRRVGHGEHIQEGHGVPSIN